MKKIITLFAAIIFSLNAKAQCPTYPGQIGSAQAGSTASITYTLTSCPSYTNNPNMTSGFTEVPVPSVAGTFSVLSIYTGNDTSGIQFSNNAGTINLSGCSPGMYEIVFNPFTGSCNTMSWDITLVGCGNTNCNNPTLGLVANYPFTGNSNDVSGNGNDGTVNGATLVADRFGNVNNAYSFNGTNNNITVNNSSSFNIESWSVSAWYKTTNNVSLSQRITSKQLNGVGSNYLSIIMQNGIIFGSADNGSIEIKTQDNIATSDGNWHNVIYTRNSTANNYKLYVDGVRKDSVADTFGTLANTGSLYIGSGDVNNQYWNGSIDDILIYNRELTICEIDSLYNIQNPQTTGIYQYSNINSQTSVYPNPAQGSFTILSAGQSNAQVFNNLGQLVLAKPFIEQTQIINLPIGIYYIKITNATGTITKKTIITQ